MALQEAHEPTSVQCVIRDGRCAIHGISASDEVELLRTQIAQLERALAAVTRPAAQVIPLNRTDVEPQAPATASEATMTPPRIPPPTLPGQHPAPQVVDGSTSETSAFASAWADDESTFEERFAARQFFYDDGPDSPSRKWLLS